MVQKNSKKVKNGPSSKSLLPISPSSRASKPGEAVNARSRMDALMDRFQEMDPFSYSPVFSRPFDRMNMLPSARTLQPLTDYWENEKEIGFSVELPGMEKKDIQLSVLDDRVEIRAEKKRETSREKKDLFQTERSFAGFYRSFSVPKNANASNATATFENEVLTLHIPKRISPKKPFPKIKIK